MRMNLTRSALALSILVPLQAWAKPWPAVIDDVRQRAETLAIASNRLGAPDAGNHFAEAIGHTHQCAILGRMLERDQYIAPLEIIEIPEPGDDMTADELMALSDATKSLFIWLAVAETLLDQPVDTRRNLWNMSCVGQSGFWTDDPTFEIPASAIIDQQITDNIQTALRCLMDTIDGIGGVTIQSCVGQLQAICMNSMQPDPTRCATFEDALWNDVVTQLANRTRAVPYRAAPITEDGNDPPRTVDTPLMRLKREHHEWLTYRAAQCGDGDDQAETLCRIEQNAAQSGILMKQLRIDWQRSQFR